MRKPIKPFFVEHRSRKPNRRDELMQEVWPDDVPVRQVREDYDYDSAIAAAEAVFAKIPAATTPVYASKRVIQTYDEQPDMSALFEQPSIPDPIPGPTVELPAPSVPVSDPVEFVAPVESAVDASPLVADMPPPSGSPRILEDMTYVSEVEQRLAAPKRRGRPRKVVQELPLIQASAPEATSSVMVEGEPVVAEEPVAPILPAQEVVAPIDTLAEPISAATDSKTQSDISEDDEFDDDEFEDDEFDDENNEVTDESSEEEEDEEFAEPEKATQVKRGDHGDSSGVRSRRRRSAPIPDTYYEGLNKNSDPEQVIEHIRALNNGDYVPLRAYCKVLNDLEIPTIRGGVWAPQTVANLIVRIEREKRLSRRKASGAPPPVVQLEQPPARRGRPRKEPTASLEPKYVYKAPTFKDEGLTKLIRRRAPKPGQNWADRIKIIRGR